MKPKQWPKGASEKDVAQCARGCEYCLALLKAKRRLDTGKSLTGKYANIESFA